ncbi:hypothetical protein ASG39_21620 [Rhizobium sp. Leaf371]|nr:hypothetical protein ASG39_21620 [Rhizobium sp. Leaf371]
MHLARGTGAVLRVRAFLGDDREATARLAGPRRLKACIQRREIGLKYNLIYDIDVVRDDDRRFSFNS